MMNWGLHQYGAKLHINETPINFIGDDLVIDIETDEKDNFVGIGFTQTGDDIYYSNNLADVTRLLHNRLATGSKLIGHNLKGDAKWLKKWGVDVKPEHLKQDTALMSYVQNTTKDSHSLKDLGKEIGLIWPTYSEMVGKGKTKLTLDKQPVETVAAYCAMDVLATWKLYQHFNKTLSDSQKKILNELELPLMRVLYEMELNGVLINVDKLKRLDEEYATKLKELKEGLNKEAGREFNPSSGQQKAEILMERGFTLPTTKTSFKTDRHTLEQFVGDPFVDQLLEYSKMSKLYSGFTQQLLSSPSLPRVYPTYNQIRHDEKSGDDIGITTNRLSCSEPNLQQIPSHSEAGLKLRELFIPREGHILIDADYSQIEPRVLAHISKDKFLTQVFTSGKDLYDSLVEGTGRSRDVAKTFWLALMYGAQAKKLARVFKCSEKGAQEILDDCYRKIPGVRAWKQRIIYNARINKGIKTLMGRFIPLPKITSKSKYERLHWERVAVSATVQGSAAEIMKLAIIKCKEAGYTPILTVHDELLFEIDMADWHRDAQWDKAEEIEKIMESIVQLDIPVIVEVGIGGTWREAKESQDS